MALHPQVFMVYLQPRALRTHSYWNQKGLYLVSMHALRSQSYNMKQTWHSWRNSCKRSLAVMKLCEVNKLSIWPVRSNYYDFVSFVNSFIVNCLVGTLLLLSRSGFSIIEEVIILFFTSLLNFKFFLCNLIYCIIITLIDLVIIEICNSSIFIINYIQNDMSITFSKHFHNK